MMAEHQRKMEDATCPSCGGSFKRRASPSRVQRTCSRGCARRREWSDGSRKPPAERRLDSYGYVWVRVPDGTPGARTMGRGNTALYMREHRFLVQQILGRPIRSSETVHHKDGNRSNNALSNLEFRAGAHGRGATEPHCPTCRCFDGAESLT